MTASDTHVIASRRSSDLTDIGSATSVTTGHVAARTIGSGPWFKTILTLTSVAVTMTDEAGVVAYGGVKLYDLPEGAILFGGAVADLDITASGGINANFDGDFGVGTVTASNNATLATTEQNIIPTTATPQAVSSVTTANGKSTATENAVVDGTSTALDVYLNFLVDDADQNGGGTITVTGTISILWCNLGDY